MTVKEMIERLKEYPPEMEVAKTSYATPFEYAAPVTVLRRCDYSLIRHPWIGKDIWAVVGNPGEYATKTFLITE